MPIIFLMSKSTGLTQAERSEHSTQQLLDAATHLIAEQGYSCTTVPEIARRAGFSHGLITQRFGSKGELVKILVKRFHEFFRLERLVPALKRSGGRDELVITLDAYLDSIVSSGELGRAYYQLYGESIMLGPDIHDTFVQADRDFRRAIEGLIKAAIATGELSAETKPKALATLLLSILRGFAMQWMRNPTAVSYEAIKAEIHHLLDRAYTSKGSGSPRSGASTPK